MDFLRTKATQKLQRSLDMARKCHQSSVCQQTSDWILLEGFTVVPAGSSSFSTTTQLRLHHGEKKMCSTSPVIAALPYLPIWMDAICQQHPRSRNPPSCDMNGFLAGVVSNSKIVTIHTCYRKCIIKDHKGPEKLKTLRQVCPLMVTSAFKGVSHGCNGHNGPRLFQMTTSQGHCLVNRLSCKQCKYSGVLPLQSGDGSKPSYHTWGDEIPSTS